MGAGAGEQPDDIVDAAGTAMGSSFQMDKGSRREWVVDGSDGGSVGEWGKGIRVFSRSPPTAPNRELTADRSSKTSPSSSTSMCLSYLRHHSQPDDSMNLSEALNVFLHLTSPFLRSPASTGSTLPLKSVDGLSPT